MDQALWLQLFLAGTVVLAILGVVSGLWLFFDWLRRRSRSVHDATDAAPPVVRGGLDYRDHPGPVVERRGPDVTERRYRDAVDRSSGANPRT